MERMYADSLGFLFDQGELMAQARIPVAERDITALKIDPAVFESLDLVHLTACPPFIRDPEKVFAEVEWMRAVLEAQGCVIVEGADDLKKPGLKVVLGLQNPPERATEGAFCGRLYNRGIRIMSLAYEMANEYAGGFAESDVPLTSEGLALLKKMEDHGVIVDLSHAGQSTALSVLNIGHRNLDVCATHSGAYSVYPHLRNLPDDVIVRIADLGGYIGVPALNWMLGPEGEDEPNFFSHLLYIEGLAGVECSGVGSDTVYKPVNMLPDGEAARTFAMMKDKLDPRGNFNPRFPEFNSDWIPFWNRSDKMGVARERFRRQWGSANADLLAGRSFCRFLQRALR